MKADYSPKWSPSFIGIGAERSATSWCWACLNEHPQICMSYPKELHYFDMNYERGEKWYRKHFNYNSQAAVLGEIGPLYMYDPLACERIARSYPNVKILVILRNPYERALSHLLLVLRNEMGVVDIDDVVLPKRFAALQDKYLERSLYFRSLKPYFTSFPRDQIIILFYEDLKLDYKAFLHSLFSHLEVRHDIMPNNADKIINRTSNYRWPLLFKALIKIGQRAKALSITDRILETLRKKTIFWSWFLRFFEFDTQNTKRHKLEFGEVFGVKGREIISADMELLVKELHIKVPANWDCQNTLL